MIVWFSVWAVIGLVVWYGLYLEKESVESPESQELDGPLYGAKFDLEYDVNQIIGHRTVNQVVDRTVDNRNM